MRDTRRGDDRAARLEAARRERRQRERDRRRRTQAQAGSRARRAARRGERAGRRAGTDGTDTPAGAGVGVATRQHEGLVGLVARGARSLAGGVESFGREVLTLVAGMARLPLRVVPAPVRALVRPGGSAGRAAAAGRAAGPRTAVPRTPERVRREQARRRSVRQRRQRALGVGLAVAVLAGAWATLPVAEALRIHHVEVRGASVEGDLEVRMLVDELIEGRSVLTVDEQAIEQRIEELPFVRDVRVDPRLPDGLAIEIDEYEPLAVGAASQAWWLVAPDGRVLAPAPRIEDWRDRVPVVTLEADRAAVGTRLDDEPTLRLLRAVPEDFPGSFQRVTMRDGALVAMLVDEREVRLGRDRDLAAKLHVAARMLRLAPCATYVDVSVPARPAPGPGC